MTDWDKMIAPSQWPIGDLPKAGTKINVEIIKAPIELTWYEEVAPLPPIFMGIDLGSKDKTVFAVIKDKIIERIYNNNMPTHDPYSNPDALIYYQCSCGAILDPLTKSFASLNNHASNAGWKVRWNKDGLGYQPFCVECGKDVE